MRLISTAFASLLTLSACSASETNMSQNASTESGLQPVVQERGQAQLNPNPKRAYEIVMTVENAPGPFAIVEGAAQYDVVNENECGHINATSGTAERITSFEQVLMRKVSDAEYRGTVYLDGMLDQDYFGRGVCHWELGALRVVLRASGQEGETLFGPWIIAEDIVANLSVDLYFWKGQYPRAEMDNYAYSGRSSREEFKPELRNDLFKITIKAQGLQP